MHPTAVLNIVGLVPSLLGDGMPSVSAFARRCGGVRSVIPDLPAVTSTVQASMLTGVRPSQHGIVGNGWFDRSLNEVHFWKQSDALVQAPRVWHAARQRDASFTCANICWWHAMHSTADITVTPRPMYPADGRKIPDIWTVPGELRGALQSDLGPFPLFRFWGPGADIRSTDWIARAAMRTVELHSPTLTLVYLPHLDYVMQREGPKGRSVRDEMREMDRVFDALLRFFDSRGTRVMVVSEYGISEVSAPIYLNRTLREAGMVRWREELGREMADPAASDAFAVCDHQVAHVYAPAVMRRDGNLDPLRRVLESVPGVSQVIDRDTQAAHGIAHARSGDFVCVAEPGHWFAYPWWCDDARAPDYARTVDIHRKPGYDPCELFLAPPRILSRAKVMWRLAQRRLGMRALLDVIPLDAGLVRGSHGRIEAAHGLRPVCIADDPNWDDVEVPATAVHDAILRQVFGRS